MSATGYRLLLCHRRREGLTRSEFQRRFPLEVSEAALGLRASLGYTRYERLDQYGHPNPLGHVMAKSRTWVPVALVSLWTGKKPPPIRQSLLPRESRELDVIEQFWWESEDQLLAALRAMAKPAATELATLTRPLVDHTVVILGPQYQVIPRACRHPATKLMFCLRRLPGASRSDMQKYWLGQHGPLVQSLQPKLKTHGYEQVHASTTPETDELAERFRVGEAEQFDGTACLWYETQEQLLETFLEADCQHANLELQKDELKFVDGQRCLLVFGEETAVYPPSSNRVG